MLKSIAQRWAEVISALGVILWGVWLLNPLVLSFQQYSVYGIMARYAREEIWGTLAVTAGLIIIVGLHIHSNLARRVGLIGVIFFRAFSFVFIGIQTEFSSNGIPDFFLWTVLAIYAYWKVEVEHDSQ